MQSISVFLDIKKVANFPFKYTNINRTERVSHDLYVFGSSLGKI